MYSKQCYNISFGNFYIRFLLCKIFLKWSGSWCRCWCIVFYLLFKLRKKSKEKTHNWRRKSSNNGDGGDSHYHINGINFDDLHDSFAELRRKNCFAKMKEPPPFSVLIHFEPNAIITLLLLLFLRWFGNGISISPSLSHTY